MDNSGPGLSAIVALAASRGPRQGPGMSKFSGEEGRPLTEAEAEAEYARSELLLQRVQARIRREGRQLCARLLREEIDRLRRERGEPEPTPEELAERDEWLAEMNRIAVEVTSAPQLDGVEEETRHPLVEAVVELALGMRQTAIAEQWPTEGVGPEHPILELFDSTLCAGPKLAGVLDTGDWPPDLELCGHAIVRLKRAREFLEDALRAAESCREEKLIRAELLQPWTKRLSGFVAQVDDLIAELRERLVRGN